MQHKIPQEMNVEDKIVGPFTLKQFGFVFVSAIVTVFIMIIFMSLGLDMVASVIIGAFFGSFSLIVCFVPYNGRPLYTFSLSLVQYFFKPRQRVWKRVDDQTRMGSVNSAEASGIQEEAGEQSAPLKESLKNAEQKIEEISLMVDTGGAYGGKDEISTFNDPGPIFDKSTPAVDNALKESREKANKKVEDMEQPLSNMATVDPEKTFDYEYPDTSNYKIGEALPEPNSEEEGREKGIKKF